MICVAALTGPHTFLSLFWIEFYYVVHIRMCYHVQSECRRTTRLLIKGAWYWNEDETKQRARDSSLVALADTGGGLDWPDFNQIVL